MMVRNINIGKSFRGNEMLQGKILGTPIFYDGPFIKYISRRNNKIRQIPNAGKARNIASVFV